MAGASTRARAARASLPRRPGARRATPSTRSTPPRSRSATRPHSRPRAASPCRSRSTTSTATASGTPVPTSTTGPPARSPIRSATPTPTATGTGSTPTTALGRSRGSTTRSTSAQSRSGTGAISRSCTRRSTRSGCSTTTPSRPATTSLHVFGVHANLVVSADHNESSPDTIGLYGALETPLGVGARSGIDEYYMKFLDHQVAAAAAQAVASLRPATLYANQIEGRIPDGASGNTYPLLNGMQQRISDEFPTSVALPGDDRVAAVDTKLGILQARTTAGTPIFTVVSLAAHNQEMGDSGPSSARTGRGRWSPRSTRPSRECRCTWSATTAPRRTRDRFRR